MINLLDSSLIHGTGGFGSAPQQRQQREQLPPRQQQRAEINYIPTAETLRTLTSNALTARKEGVYVDRGSILNILV